MTTGTFGPRLLIALNGITSRMAALHEERERLLAAYSDGAGLPPGRFAWDDQTGAWQLTPAETPVPSSLPPDPAPQPGPEATPAEPNSDSTPPIGD